MMMLDSGIARSPVEIMQSGHLADRPMLAEGRRRVRVTEVHDLPLERRAVLVQSDQDLLAVGGEWMEMESERHDPLNTLVIT